MTNNTVGGWLSTSKIRLKQADIESYNLDSLILLEHVTEFERAYILAHQDDELTAKQILKLNKLLARRCEREPIAYIIGEKEFYGRKFIVNKDVLIPRPESESFIELLKKHNITHQKVADIGCGSGIIGITAKLEIHTLNVTLSDIDEKALKIAKLNAKNLNSKSSFIQSDLLPTNSDDSVVLANLPYVPKNLELAPELSYEPKLALFADDDGLALYIKLWHQIGKSTTISHVLTESLATQHSKMIALAKKAGFNLIDNNGLVQIFKND